jgi:hypothetical protein
MITWRFPDASSHDWRQQLFRLYTARVNFRPIHSNVLGRRNAKAHALATYFSHDDPDVAADDNFLACTTR